VEIKYSAVRGWPFKLMKANPATTPRKYKAEDELKSSAGRTEIQGN